MRSTFLLLMLILGFTASSQSEADSTFTALKPALVRNGNLLRSLPFENQRDSAATLFITDLLKLVAFEEAMQMDLISIGNLSVIDSEDDKVRIITYMVPRAGGSYTHVGFLLYLDEDDQYHHVQLLDNAFGSVEYKPLNSSNWYGGLYYNMIPKRIEGRTVYVLLGYRAKNPMIHEKFIDVLDLANDRVQFGLPIFYVEQFNDRVYQRQPYRMTLQFSAKVSAVLQWNEDYNGIVMDHLAPPDINQKGVYMTYGPDFTYDALVWEDDMWHLREQITFKNNTQTAPANPNVPTGLGPNSSRRTPQR